MGQLDPAAHVGLGDMGEPRLWHRDVVQTPPDPGIGRDPGVAVSGLTDKGGGETKGMLAKNSVHFLPRKVLLDPVDVPDRIRDDAAHLRVGVHQENGVQTTPEASESLLNLLPEGHHTRPGGLAGQRQDAVEHKLDAGEERS